MDNPIYQGLLRRHQIALRLSSREDIQLLRGTDFDVFARLIRQIIKVDHYVTCCIHDIINGLDISRSL